MYLSRVFNRVRPTRQTRLISNYQTLRDSKATDKPTVVGEPTPNAEPTYKDSTMDPGRQWITPTNADKRILVWMKYYKKIDEVPDKIGYKMIENANSKFRIRCCNIMMIIVLTCFFVSVKLGKKRAGQGENLENMNLVWHDKLDELDQDNLDTVKAAKIE